MCICVYIRELIVCSTHSPKPPFALYTPKTHRNPLVPSPLLCSIQWGKIIPLLPAARISECENGWIENSPSSTIQCKKKKYHSFIIYLFFFFICMYIYQWQCMMINNDAIFNDLNILLNSKIILKFKKKIILQVVIIFMIFIHCYLMLFINLFIVFL